MLKQAERIQRIHELIRRKATGTPKELATRLGISARQLYNLLDLMKELGAPILYSNTLCSYYYEHEVAWSIGFASLGENSMAKIKANGIFSTNFYPLQYNCSHSLYTCA
jgi:DNA-binding IclR family transcriptional regulator